VGVRAGGSVRIRRLMGLDVEVVQGRSPGGETRIGTAYCERLLIKGGGSPDKRSGGAPGACCPLPVPGDTRELCAPGAWRNPTA